MNVPLLDLRAQYLAIRHEVRAALDGVCESQNFILGAQVAALEREIALYCGTSYAVGVSSGTDALLSSWFIVQSSEYRRRVHRVKVPGPKSAIRALCTINDER